jgi:hypothetical protein
MKPQSVDKIVEEYAREYKVLPMSKHELKELLTSYGQQMKEEERERILKLAPGFENTKTGEITYDVGVIEWQARINSQPGDIPYNKRDHLHCYNDQEGHENHKQCCLCRTSQ